MATTKITKKDYFNAIYAVIAYGESLAYPVEDVKSFINNELALLAKKANKASTKPTKSQVENSDIKTAILSTLSAMAKPVTISELMSFDTKLGGYSNQKLSALMKQLVDAGLVEKTIEKKKSYFSIPEQEDITEETEVDVTDEDVSES